MDTLDHAVKLAERVVTLRSELAVAEEELRRMFGRPIPIRGIPKPSVGTRPTLSEVPISRRVRDLLHDARTPLSFGELVDLVGGRDKAMAARAALKKLRAKKDVRFGGGRYSWAAK